MTPQEATVAVIEALEATDIPYMVVGSFSSNYYGISRSTKDADLVVELGPQGAAAAFANRSGGHCREISAARPEVNESAGTECSRSGLGRPREV